MWRVFQCSIGTIMEGVLSHRIFLRSTRTSRRAHPFVVDCPVNHTMHYREKSFFARTARLWSDLPSEAFLVGYDIGKFKSNIHKQSSLFSSFYKLFYCMSRDHPLIAGFTIQKNMFMCMIKLGI